ncbi:MAG: hypothetical protein HZA89_01770 [Verrucomicrobia bacterium]|nr:hypothetical protein [Verrucomicrobiota bacterium]
MKPSVFTLCLVSWLALADAGGAATLPLRWRWSNPQPHGNNVVDMAYSSLSALAVQVAERGQIYTSSDFQTWTAAESGVTNALRGVAFFGISQRIIIVGENGAALYADSTSQFLPATLPATTNWLEGVTASPGTLVAVGDNGSVYASTTGTNWVKQTFPFTNWLRSVAFGIYNSSPVFVTVGEAGFVATSANGTSWNKRTVSTTADLNRVSCHNGVFRAVGNGGVYLTSVNGGSSWTVENTGATNDLFAVITTTSGSQTNIVVAGDNEARLHNGTAWQNLLNPVTTNSPPTWTYYAGCATPGLLLLAGRTGMMAEGYAVGGVYSRWLAGSDSLRQWLWDVHHIQSGYFAVGDYGSLLSSVDGVSWTIELPPDAATNSVLLGIGGDTNLLVAVGDSGVILVSTNSQTAVLTTNTVGTNTTITTNFASNLGVLWNAATSPTTTNLQGVCRANNLFVVTGAGGKILTSTNGSNWTTRAAPTTALLSSVTAFSGGWVAVGDAGTILTSPDAVTWTARNFATTNWIYRVRQLNGTLLAVGQNGLILTSTNGVNWASRASGTTKWLNDAAYLDGIYLTTGTQGALLISTNAVDWSDAGTITKKALYGLATDGSQLVAVGVEGAILRSPVVADPTPVTFAAYNLTAATNSVEHLFLFGGKPDQQFNLEGATALGQTNSWTTGKFLEITDPAGLLYYLETNPLTNSTPQEFFRARMFP